MKPGKTIPRQTNQIRTNPNRPSPSGWRKRSTTTCGMANFSSYFISQLDVPELGTTGTYLDNSLVFWGNVISDGKSHNHRDMQVITAGSLGGRIKAGKYINYTNDQGHGRTYNAFLVAILQAFGLSEPDYKLPNVASGFGCDGLFDEYLHRVQTPEPWRNERASPSPGILV